MKYQEKILKAARHYMDNVSLKSYEWPFNEEEYEKLLYHYKLCNHNLFDQTVSEHFRWFVMVNINCLESGRHYKKSFLTRKKRELHGPFEMYWPNDNLESKGNYKNGKLHGLHQKWYENGQLKIELTYVDGLYDGECKRWHENGQLSQLCHFKLDTVKDSYYWDKNGKPYSVYSPHVPATLTPTMDNPFNKKTLKSGYTTS